MSIISRTVRLIALLSIATMLAMPALAAAQAQPAGSATTDDEFCMYQGRTDTPEIGPLPCDESRPHMIGHSRLGGNRISADSEHNSGPKSHLNADGSVPAAVDSSEHGDGVSASPSLDAGANSDPSPDVEAP